MGEIYVKPRLLSDIICQISNFIRIVTSDKNHGTYNGIFYKNRHKSDYFTQTTPIHPDYLAVNRLLKGEWQGKYVNLLSLTMRSDSTVLVFTPDHHFFTYDGKHLTPSGARYYSGQLFK